MIGNETDLVFPQRLIPGLLHQRGSLWQELVDKTMHLEANDLEAIAFTLLIARLASCPTCHVDTLRALRGCAQCGRLAVARYRGSDQELVSLYNRACQEITDYVQNSH